jgi:hypothetical protein
MYVATCMQILVTGLMVGKEKQLENIHLGHF